MPGTVKHIAFHSALSSKLQLFEHYLHDFSKSIYYFYSYSLNIYFYIIFKVLTALALS